MLAQDGTTTAELLSHHQSPALSVGHSADTAHETAAAAAAAAAAATASTPLVVLITWVWAKERIVKAYIDLYISLGCEVRVFHTPVLSMWSPAWASLNASRILRTLEAEVSQSRSLRPIIFALFSGAAKGSYYKLLQQLEPVPRAAEPVVGAAAPQTLYPAVNACFAGQIFDSGPVDFTSQAGVKLLSLPPPSSNTGSTSSTSSTGAQPKVQPALVSRSLIFAALSSTGQAVASVTAGLLDFALLEVFEQQRREMWQSLATLAGSHSRDHVPTSGGSSRPPAPQLTTASSYQPAVPTLLLYSWDDPLADPLRIHQLAQALRKRGGPVLEQAWESSEHVGHLRRHGHQYREMVARFVDAVAQAWRGAGGGQEEHGTEGAESSAVGSSYAAAAETVDASGTAPPAADADVTWLAQDLMTQVTAPAIEARTAALLEATMGHITKCAETRPCHRSKM